MLRKGSLHSELFINVSCYYCCSWETRGQHQALDHVLQGQELLEAPLAPISVPLPNNAEAGCLGAETESLSLIPGA